LQLRDQLSTDLVGTLSLSGITEKLLSMETRLRFMDDTRPIAQHLVKVDQLFYVFHILPDI
jgi:hypothetical protein